MSAVPTELSYHRQSRRLEIAFERGERYVLSGRVPSGVFALGGSCAATGRGRKSCRPANSNVAILEIEPVGNYAVCLHFDDGHRTGIYSWDELRWLGENRDELWARYLERLKRIRSRTLSVHEEHERGGPRRDFRFRADPSLSEKRGRVQEVFDTVAGRYDLMNDLMSFGLHRVWKRIAVELARVRPGQRVLDLAAGSGDLAASARATDRCFRAGGGRRHQSPHAGSRGVCGWSIADVCRV